MAVDPLRIAEPDLDLGRMDVDVNLLGWDLQVQERDRIAPGHQQPAVGLAQGVAQRPVADIAAAQEEELALVARPALRRVGDIAPEGQVVEPALHPEQRLRQLAAAEDGDPVTGMRERIAIFCGRELAESLLWVESRLDNLSLWGYVAHPSQSRSSNKGQFLFLGGRYVRDRSLGHALGE